MSEVFDNTVPNEDLTNSNLNITEGDSNLLSVLSGAHNPALSDDVFNVIRAIVPPPPPVQTYLSAGDGSSSREIRPNEEVTECPERLYSRRSSEECLLRRIKSQSSSSKEARISLEELFFQIIEPKKYTDQDFILHTVLELMDIWSKEEAIQQLALSSFLCLSQQCDTFHLSEQAVFSVVNCMKLYHRNETIQRMGVKVLKDKRVLQQVQKKDQIASVVFNSLCHLHHVNDFIVYAKDIVEEVCPNGRILLRTSKSYVEMLLTFPYRKNVTIYLSWCSLDILTLLADSQERWDTLWGLDGKSRIQRLSQRPEFEDRCRKLIDIAFVKHNDLSSRENRSPLVEDIDSPSRANKNLGGKPVTQLLRFSESLKLNEGSRICSDIRSGCTIMGVVENDAQENPRGYSDSGNRHLICLPVDELVTRQPPTPPSTVADFEECDRGEFSDDDCNSGNHESSRDDHHYGFCAPSPSYSPPPLCAQFGEFQELFNENENLASEETCSATVKNCTLQKIPNRGYYQAEGVPIPKTQPNGKVSTVYPCFICREPRVKQSLLMKQLSQISHCLHQPYNKLLLKCLQSNVCGDHKM